MLDPRLQSADGNEADRERRDEVHNRVGLHASERYRRIQPVQGEGDAETHQNAPDQLVSIRRTISLPVDLDRALRSYAARRGVRVGVLIRMLLSASMERPL
jgi:hypothetical protein